MEIREVWEASDYGPTGDRLATVAPVLADLVESLSPSSEGTSSGDGSDNRPGLDIVDMGAGHGQLAATLARRGHRVTAVDPTPAMIEAGRARTGEGVRWVDGRAEASGLPDASADVLVSSFAWMFVEPAAAVTETARLLRPGGWLVTSIWNRRGFLDEMTDRMVAATGMAPPPFMEWTDEGVAEHRLAGTDRGSPLFDEVALDDHDLPWWFESVADGMAYYRTGSPTHAMTLAAAGDRRDALVAALEQHLAEHAGTDGRITSSAGYTVLRARRTDAPLSGIP